MCKFLHEPQSYDKTGVFRWFKTLPLAPEFHPTLEEFKDPIGLPIRVVKLLPFFYRIQSDEKLYVDLDVAYMISYKVMKMFFTYLYLLSSLIQIIYEESCRW